MRKFVMTMMLSIGTITCAAQSIIEDFKPSACNQPGQPYPMVNSQGYIRFQIKAPQANDIYIGLGGGVHLTKNEDGVWTGITKKPEDEGFHYYTINIDGVTAIDPATNPYFGCGRWVSGIEIPAKDEEFYARRDVIHRQLVKVNYPSALAAADTRWMYDGPEAWVYLPPQYDGVQEFPVLYLQHGYGENETSWMLQDKANLIMDNLIAEGKCSPFIVVMTYGLTNECRFGHLDEFDWTIFERVLVDDLIPYIDSHFKTKAQKEFRAIAGLSMGSMETRQITMARPETFSYYGLFSGALYQPEDIKCKESVKHVFISCGSKEFPDRVQQSVKALNEEGIPTTGYVSEGTAHEFQTWRRSLKEFVQLLFK